VRTSPPQLVSFPAELVKKKKLTQNPFWECKAQVTSREIGKTGAEGTGELAGI